MLNKLSINLRVLMLILIPTVIFAIIGYFSYISFKINESNFATTDDNLKMISIGADLSTTIDEHYTHLLSNVRKGKVSWGESTQRAREGQQIILDKLSDYNEATPVDLLDSNLINSLAIAQEKITKNHMAVLKFLANRSGTETDLHETAGYLIDDQFSNAQEMQRTISLVDNVVFNNVSSNTSNMVDAAFINSKSIITAISIGSFIIIIVGFLIARSIKRPTKEL